MEKWKAVVEYEGHYEVSDHGRIRSVARVRTSYGGREWLKKEKILRPTLVKGKGYMVVSLCLDGTAKRRYVHDVVLSAFVGPRPSPKSHCCHGSAGPSVNCLENLRWDTPRANVMDKHRDGTMPIGENHGMNIYSEAQIKAVKDLLADGWRVREISEQTLVHASTVQQVKKGRQWVYLA